jgi:hypothetical protein
MHQLLKLIFCLFLLLLTQSFCLAEDDKIFLVSLKKEKIELTYFPYKFKEIIDNRYNKITIGNVQRDVFNKRWPATFELDMQVEVQQMFAASSLMGSRPEDYSIIINSIWINEIPVRSEEKGIVNLEFSIAKQENGNFSILSTQNVMIEERVIDATTNHDSRIAAAFQKGLKNFQITPKYKYLNEAFAVRVNNPDSIIYKTKKISKGIFRTPQDLAFNTPDTSAVFFTNVDYIKDQSFVRDKLDIKQIQDVFAFSNGEHIYLNSFYYGNQSLSKAGYAFDKILITGAINLFQTTLQNADASLAVMTGMSVGFGLLGALIASSIDMSKEYTFLLDLRYGTLMELNKDNLTFLLTAFPNLQLKFSKLGNQEKDYYDTQIQFIKRMNELIAKQ